MSVCVYALMNEISDNRQTLAKAHEQVGGKLFFPYVRVSIFSLSVRVCVCVYVGVCVYALMNEVNDTRQTLANAQE